MGDPPSKLGTGEVKLSRAYNESSKVLSFKCINEE
jgi:hypothetical protein